MNVTTKYPYITCQFEKLDPQEMQQRATEFYELMDKRRSVREFSPEPIPEGVLEACIKTASTAPSGAHKQPWYFCVIRDPEIKHAIRLAAEKEERENYEHRFPEDWLQDLEIFGTNEHKEYLDIAPALVVIFRENYQIVDGKRVKNYYVNESAGIAAGMFIAALHNAGLASLTHTPNPMAFLNQILKRPKNETPILLMPVGYPKSGTKIPDLQRKPLESIMAKY